MRFFSREDEDGIAVIRIGADDDVHLTAEASAELDAITAALEADPAVRVIVFTGRTPGYFIRHYSVDELVGLSDHLRRTGYEAREASEPRWTGLDQSIRRIENMAKPVIAAINGHCMGGGFEFALGADIRIAQHGDYGIGLPEVTVAILPGGGGTQRLARLIGISGALDLVLEGRVVGPQEAARRGLVSECVEGLALDRALERARHMATLDPRAVGHIKRLVRATAHLPLLEGLKLERNLFMDLVVRDPANARMKAYVAGAVQFTDEK